MSIRLGALIIHGVTLDFGEDGARRVGYYSFMTLRSLALSGIMLSLCLGYANAQSGINAMVSIPMGDYSDAEALVGFGVTLENNSPVAEAVGWVNGISLIYNATDKDLPSGIKAEGGNYITIPALTGLRATGGGSGPVKFYVQGQAGIVLFLVTDLTIGDAEVSTDPNIHFGFGGGSGLIFNDRVNVGLRFFGTPEMDLNGTISTTLGSGDIEGELTESMVQITIGLLF